MSTAEWRREGAQGRKKIFGLFQVMKTIREKNREKKIKIGVCFDAIYTINEGKTILKAISFLITC